MAGYSGTPLPKKLGIKPGGTIVVSGFPGDYAALLGDPDVTYARSITSRVDLVHLFATKQAALAAKLTRLRETIRPDAAVWVSWPKKSARIDTDITENVIRTIALPMGFVDTKVCAVDETWSGLKLVIRKELRG